MKRTISRGLAMLVAASVIAVLPSSPALAAAEDWIDPGFGSGGAYVLPEEPVEMVAFALDAAGRSYVASPTDVGPRLRRLTTDGAVDPTFGGGLVTPAKAPTRIHADAGGTVTMAAVDPGGTGVVVSRLTSTGTPAAGFGSGGSVTILPGVSVYFVRGIVERPDGSLVVLVVSGPTTASYLVGLTSTGTLDPTWAPTATVPGILALDGVSIRAIAADGMSIVASEKPETTDGGGSLRRYTPAGAVDGGFGTGGSLAFASTFYPQDAMLTIAGGAYYVGGSAVVGAALDRFAPAVARVLPSGSLDSGFGTLGVAAGRGHPGCPSAGLQVVVTASYVTVMGGFICDADPLLFLRFTPDGALDPAFGDSGELSIHTLAGKAPLGGYFDMAAQPDGRLVLAGIVGDVPANNYDTVVFRLANQLAPLPGAYVPVAPSRILDTRSGNGAVAGVIPGGGSIELQVAGRGGVPATGAAAVVMNVTVTQPSQGGNVVVYPTGDALPLASNLNFTAGQTIPNLVTVKLGTDGKVTLTNNSAGTVHLVADVAGYYVAGTAALPGTFTALTPTRILDTRTGNGAAMAAVPGGGSIELQVGGRGGVPATDAGAVVLNVTVTQPSTNGNVVAYPTGAAFPLASNLNFLPGQTIPNLVTVKLGTDGKVTLKNNSTGTVHLVADVAGYYRAGVATARGTFVALTPTRILDTRVGNGAPAAAVPGPSSINLQVTNRGGVPRQAVAAVVMNVTVTQPTWEGNVVAYPAGAAFPLASNLNFGAGQTIPNLVIVKLGNDGMVTLKNNSVTGSLHLVADVSGYFNT